MSYQPSLFAHLIEDEELISTWGETFYFFRNSIMIDLLVEKDEGGLLVNLPLNFLVELQPLFPIQQGSRLHDLFLQARSRIVGEG